jgi:ATP-dependent helicase HrpB
MTHRPLPELPINEALPALGTALQTHTRVLLDAPPGAGKSTIVPLALLQAPWLGGKILMLEPRRLAARAVANRMAQLRGEPVGKTVGYRTRLDTKVSHDTRVEVVTEGILTRMLQQDPELPGISLVIFDEFHERSLNADLGLALCLESQQNLREDLRLLVMSATLDLEPLARLLNNAPIVAARGRSFDVQTYYIPRRNDLHLELQMASTIRRALAEHEGDVLCFLPGAAEITRVQRNLEAAGMESDAERSHSERGDSGGHRVRVLPLYGELTGAAQDAALAPAPPGQRKVVLATSIAETSLTIEGVRVVIDSGLRRYSEFDTATGMSRLVTVKVSQAAADQRRGRAGRISAGHCFRLWSEGTQATLPAHSDSEILHADLAPLALELSCWGATDAASLRWLDPPPAAPLAQARDLLYRLDAIGHANRVTAHGRALSKVGAHPRLAHMLVRSRSLGACRLACDLAALLSERDILRAGFGARDVDLRLRIGVMHGEKDELPAGVSVDARALAQATRTSAGWQREFGRDRADTADPHTATGALLALAYPDRIGRARGEGGRYVLANGRGARFAEPQALAKSEFIVAAELDGADREARIHLAAPVTLADIEALFAAQVVDEAQISWDDRTSAVQARRVRRFGQLTLESKELTSPDPDAVQAAVLVGLKTLGVASLPWTSELEQWRARVALLRRYEVAVPEPWPDLSDDTLLATLDDWAPPWIVGMTRKEHFSRIDLGNALRSRLSYAQSAILDREAPTHCTVPSGSRIPIDYLDGDIPTISVRLQEMFGLHATPSVAAGKLPLLLKLLSPARRPVQITRDLVSFWERGYHEVRKDLKGRYPKHYWPDDPYTAAPTVRRSGPRTA